MTTINCRTALFTEYIYFKGKYFFIDDGPYLESLEHVVDYYSNISDGLPGTLRVPVFPRPKPPIPEVSAYKCT